MERFLHRHQGRVTGVSPSFDRLLFRRALRSIGDRNGMNIVLSSQRVLYRNFSPFAQRVFDRLKEQAHAPARQMDRAGIEYEQQDDCFTSVEDVPGARGVFDRLTERRWPHFLNAPARRVIPWIASTSGLDLCGSQHKTLAKETTQHSIAIQREE